MAMKRTIDFHLNDQRKKANLYRAIKNDLGNDSSTDEESLSLSPANLFPLSHYANDPEQLIQQLFSVVRGERLTRLIPPELKDMTFEELKADCLIQLLSMSKKRVLATLEGKEMNSSSDSDDSVDDNKKQNKLETEKKDEIGQKRHHKEKRMKSSKKKKNETDSETEQEKSKEREGKTLLEILELEMKAKAIRALLGPSEKDNNTQIEEAIKNDIIGKKIEEKNDDNKSWNERYEQRDDVKDVVKTSKLCTNMRRRMLLHQQKMLADRAKLKAAEAENIKSGDTIKSKLEEKLQNVYPKNDGEQLNVNSLEKNPYKTVKEPLGDCDTTQNTDVKLQETNKLHNDDITKINRDIATSSSEARNTNNTQESTDDDSQKSTDFEKVLSEYTHKNTDLEKTINAYSKKNTDLEEEINECSKRNDDMENTMNKCAQKNSDIESAMNNYAVEINGVDDSIVKENEKKSEMETAIGKYSQTNTDLDSMINQCSKKNVDLNAIVKEYAKRNSDIMTLISEYSQNNVDIQSVIGEYAKGNLKLETIIDEYSLINAKIKTMVNEYSVNNSNVEKIIDRNNRKQLLVDKYNVESAAGNAVDADCTKKIIEITGVTCEASNLDNMETNIESTHKLVDELLNEEDKKD